MNNLYNADENSIIFQQNLIPSCLLIVFKCTTDNNIAEYYVDKISQYYIMYMGRWRMRKEFLLIHIQYCFNVSINNRRIYPFVADVRLHISRFKPASNDLGVYVNKFGKTSVVWRYTLQSIGPSGIALNY